MAAASKTKNEEISHSENEENGNIGECPVCSETRTNTRYYSCLKGHAICVVCKAETSKCGTCQGGFSDPPARNLAAVEQYIQANPALPCKNKSYGCPFVGTSTQRLGHESDTCLFVPAPCPAPTCSQMVAVNKMNKHIEKVHNDEWIYINMDTVIDTSLYRNATKYEGDVKYSKDKSSFKNNSFGVNEQKTFESRLNLKLKSNDKTPPKFEFSLVHIKYKEEDFYLIVEYDPKTESANFYFYARGPLKLSSRFNAFIEISNPPYTPKIVNYSKTTNLWTERVDILESTASLTLPKKQMAQFGKKSDDGEIVINARFYIIEA